jgi:iron(III) transport system ATP-binding protein
MITTTNLYKSFTSKVIKARTNAIDGVSLTVPQGSIFTLLGPSGCGKSTTLRCIAGLERPDKGEIMIGDQIAYSSERRTFVPTHQRNIGMVFQSYAIWPHMTVFQNVSYSLKIQKVSKKETQRRVSEVLELVGLGGFAHRGATQLSGGQQQRVALARAIVSEPKALLLDEPLSNLDAQLRVQMREEIKRLQTRLGITVLYVTHDQEEALAISDQIAVLKEGKIIQIGSPEEIYNLPENRFTAEFIGSTNIIEGQFVSSEGSNQVVDTPIGKVRAFLTKGKDVPQGQATISIRPEKIRLSSSGTDRPDYNVFQGTVESVIFLGGSKDVKVRIKDQFVNIKDTDNDVEYSIGSVLYVNVHSKHCVIIGD